jgi:hypothetical protein
MSGTRDPNNLVRALRAATLACSALAMLGGSPAAHADVKPDPGDYTALPPGTDLALLYLQHHEADDLYVNGRKVVDNLGLSLDVGVLRFVHFTELGGYVIDPQIMIPFGRQEVDLAGTEQSGLGDIFFGGTLWLVNKPKDGEYFGTSVFLTAPTGSDKNQGFALSDNRWKLDLQAGYIRKLAANWTMDVHGEVEFYQDQRDTGAERYPLIQLYGHLRYHLSDATYVGATWRHGWGAKETLDGTTLAGRKDNDNLLLTWASFLTPQWQLQLQYSHDVHVEDGPRTQGIQTRILYAY